jgi:hypothetical protein
MSTASRGSEGKGWLNAGWILVSGLLALCIAGTWMTARNYREQVFSSANGTVLENQWPESRISVELPGTECKRIRPGQMAKITVGADKTALKGAVVLVSPIPNKADESMIIVKLLEKPGAIARPNEPPDSTPPHHYLPAGTTCAVTIDTTVPVLSDEFPAPSVSPR